MKSILLIVDYFGRWPEWGDVFLRSCGHNPSIDWIINTDCPLPTLRPDNVHFAQWSFDDYCRHVSDRLDLEFSPYLQEDGKPPVPLYTNLCDLRPCYGLLHAEAIGGYDYIGWCDIDLVFGNLRRFLTPEVLERDVVTFSSGLCSGHFTLLKNEASVLSVYRDIPRWRQRIQGRQGYTPWDDCLDEAWLSRLCSPNPDFRDQALQAGVPLAVIDRHRRNNAFLPELVTPFVPSGWFGGERLHPEVWYWRDGAVRNWRDGEREFPYLHFMNFKAHRYIEQKLYEMQHTWGQVSPIDPAALVADVIRIDRDGIVGISDESAHADQLRLREDQRVARGIDMTGLSFQDALQALRPAGVRWQDNSLVDRAGVVSPATREALWRERGSQSG